MIDYLHLKKLEIIKLVLFIYLKFEEAKRNAIFLSRSKNDFPSKYFLIHKKFLKVKGLI